jgi:hypothetical protein
MKLAIGDWWRQLSQTQGDGPSRRRVKAGETRLGNKSPRKRKDNKESQETTCEASFETICGQATQRRKLDSKINFSHKLESPRLNQMETFSTWEGTKWYFSTCVRATDSIKPYC